MGFGWGKFRVFQKLKGSADVFSAGYLKYRWKLNKTEYSALDAPSRRQREVVMDLRTDGWMDTLIQNAMTLIVLS